MQGRRVVVTGLGALSPVGLNVQEIWQNILSGQSGIEPLENIQADDLTVRFSGQVKNFDPSIASPGKLARQADAFVLYGAQAAFEAINDSQLDLSTIALDRAGVAFGSGIGGLLWIEKNHEALVTRGARRVSPFFITGSIINTVAGRISINSGFKGPNVSVVSACATGVHNIGLAARMIAYGEADVMLAGGAESQNTELNIAGFASMKALSTRNDDPKAASRPFDKDRDGFVVGEGACALVLESYEHAKARGAKIYAEVVGFGMSADAGHMTAPSSDGGARAMKSAIQDAGCQFTDIGHINAHATSTPLGDLSELKAIESVFADHAPNIAISATKSMTGHLLGATGAIESMFSILALQDQIAPPTINLDNPDGNFNLNLVPHKSQSIDTKYALCNSFGFGGTNASILFKKIDEGS